MGDRQEQFSGTHEVRDAHRFDVRQLEEYMLSHVESFHGPLTVKQFKGGQSNPTYLLESPSGKYVMRRKPPGKLLKSAHAVDREFTVISALYAVDWGGGLPGAPFTSNVIVEVTPGLRMGIVTPSSSSLDGG